jgi:hypothetical protein
MRLYFNITERQEGRQSNDHIKQITEMSKNYGVKIKYIAKVRLEGIIDILFRGN